MSVEIDPNMPGLDAASALLDEMIAAEAATPTSPAATAAEASEKEEAQLAAPQVEQNAQAPTTDLPDTPAAPAEASAQPEIDKSKEAKAEPAKPEKESSRYAKAQGRLNKTWESVNTEKTALAAEKTKLEAERLEFTRKRAEFDAIQEQARQPQFRPEDYQQAADAKKQYADHLLAEAKRADDEGEFAKSKALVKRAIKADAIGEDLAEHAEKLRKNPPAEFAQRAAQFESTRKAWTVEAAKAYPDLAKDGSPFQNRVAAHQKALAQSDPQLLAQPSLIYHISRLAAAELQAEALKADVARVPVLEKQVGELQAKVKEFQSLTATASPNSVAKLGTSSSNTEEEDLYRMANELVMLR